MKRALPLVVALVPGLAVAAAALAGLSSCSRDLPTYFVPLRHHLGRVLTGGQGAFWNPYVGCGEPFFANPQSCVLYPPAWAAAALPAPQAVGLEVGLHLAILGAGCTLLSRRLGARPGLAAAAGVACACSGPVASAAGVLNNLDTVAWLPWLWFAAMAGSLPGLAAVGALAWLGGEPTLAVVGGAVALALAPTRRTMGGLALGLALVAVQGLPFAVWAAGGDRGGEWLAVASALPPLWVETLPALLLPGTLPAAGGAAPFVANPTLPLWAVCLAALTLAEGGTARRLLARVGWLLAALAILPGSRAGETLWSWITAGLVRYPARLLFPAAVALVTAGAASPRRLPRGAGAALGAAAAAAGLALGAPPWAALTAGCGAAAVLTGVAPTTGALVATLPLVPAALATLELQRTTAAVAPPCLDAQRAARRVYVVEPSEFQAAWVAADWPARAHALAWGYTPLLDGRRTVRTFAPLQSRRLALHLAQADRGPVGRWWLDALAADVLLSPTRVAGFPERCAAGGVSAQENDTAWPEVFVASAMPEVGRRPRPAGQVLGSTGNGDVAAWEVAVEPPGGVLVRCATPDPGWRYSVDGRRTSAALGAGIVHGVPLPPGRHLVRAAYRPAGAVLGCSLTMFALGVLAGVPWRRW